MSTPGYCLHRCSCPSDRDCPHFSCGCEDEQKRAEECDCPEPHEDPDECAPWLREHDGEPKETDE